MEVPAGEFGSGQQDEGMSPIPETWSSLDSTGTGTFFKKQVHWLPFQCKVAEALDHLVFSEDILEQDT